MTRLSIALPLAIGTAFAAPFAFAQGTGPGFTEEQATRGLASFTASCSGCHGADLGGGGAPPLAGDVFHTAWEGQTVGALYAYASENMPRYAPGSLEPAVYADIIAYILQFNGFAAGDTELAPDAADATVLTFADMEPPPEASPQ